MSENSALNPTPEKEPLLRSMANGIRALAMDAVERSNSGHPGMPMGMADVATVLFSEFLKFDSAHPLWADRDRFVLSAGHGSMLLYALNYLTGYEGMTLEELKNFRQWGSRTAGHPEVNPALGIETTTGPLGQGLGNSVGMALAERILNGRFGAGLVDHYTYVIVGDGCLMEGISHEAISLAGHLGLGKLIVLFDDNQITIDGPTDLSVSDDQAARFKACGWHVQAIDGHDFEAIRQAIQAAQASDQPSMIACRTTIGYGAPTKAGKAASHGAPLGADEIVGARKALDWPYGPFEIPDEVLKSWRQAGTKNRGAFESWSRRLEGSKNKEDFLRIQSGEVPENLKTAVFDLKKSFIDEGKPLATRQSSGKTLDVLASTVPELLGGSADLSGSNNTKAKTAQQVTAPDYEGNYVYYGVREHGMAAAMNGIALHGGLIPYGGTFLVFTDYCRPSIRLAALMNQRVIFVMTHDSIGLGEDGPTHQPIEHLASLRAIPNLNVFRPADAVEVVECWEAALRSRKTPSVIALTRQKLPLLRGEATPGKSLAAGGAYILAGSGNPEVTLIATGSEVELALGAREKLAEEGIEASVVSMPCCELFDEQSYEMQREILGADSLRVAIEAGATYGWHRYVGDRGLVIGLDHFGESAPYQELYKQFGLTVDRIVGDVKAQLKEG